MTRNEYQELVEFIGPRFDSLERRLARVEVGNEENAQKIQVLAEGITVVDQKLDRFREEVTEEFRAVRGEMAEGLGAVRGEMAEGFRVQGDRIDGLGARTDRWEGRTPRPGRI